MKRPGILLMVFSAMCLLAAISIIVIADDSPRTVENEKTSNAEIEAHPQIITSLTFQNNDAEAAMELYVRLSESARIIDITRWGPEGPGEEGRIMQAVFELKGHRFMVSDSPPVHDWDFTPAVSTMIACDDDAEIQRLFSLLSENGTVAMPLGDYGFSRKFAWVIDPFGVSWQLNLD